MKAAALDALAPVLSRLPTGWRLKAVIAGGVLVAVYAIYRLIPYALADENRPAGEQIVAAVEMYKLNNKKYPEKLAQLQPKYLAKIPRPAPGTNFVYATSSDGATAWFGYQTPRDTFNEYDSRTRKWQQNIDYEDSDALRMRTKEFVMGPR